jgi:hypothetical protein
MLDKVLRFFLFQQFGHLVSDHGTDFGYGDGHYAAGVGRFATAEVDREYACN